MISLVQVENNVDRTAITTPIQVDTLPDHQYTESTQTLSSRPHSDSLLCATTLYDKLGLAFSNRAPVFEIHPVMNLAGAGGKRFWNDEGAAHFSAREHRQ
ncbi:MAG TPA: hypothetical protein VN937_02870 [Blastocatellia bacterium]|nr:hypothetical protein [Blastocatellia bacterium]